MPLFPPAGFIVANLTHVLSVNRHNR